MIADHDYEMIMDLRFVLGVEESDSTITEEEETSRERIHASGSSRQLSRNGWSRGSPLCEDAYRHEAVTRKGCCMEQKKDGRSERRRKLERYGVKSTIENPPVR